jgi:tRNA/tmRNA/rRNA uracil-C5-methylase (TrmA/RlmC/RlmD family)
MPKPKPSRKPSKLSPNRPGGRRGSRNPDERPSEGDQGGRSKGRNKSEYDPRGSWEPEGSYQASRVKRTADQARKEPSIRDKDSAFPGSRDKGKGRGKKHPGNKTLGRDGQGARVPLARVSGKPVYRGGKTERVPVERAPEKIIRFSDILIQLARKEAPTLVGPSTSPEPLARLDYATELDLKNRAMQQFWTVNGLPDKPNRITPSPLPRHYRTTTKRRVIFEKGGFHLDFLPDPRAGAERLGARSALEPIEHATLYHFILTKLNQPAYSQIAHALNYLVIRGDYTRFSVIFNVHQMNGNVVRKAKLLSEHLQTMDPKTTSAFLFHDAGKSPFYLDQRSPEGAWKFKKLFGPDNLRLKVGDKNYAFHPTSFCQVNASILPAFLEKAHQLLKARPEQRLIDLYCGFGLFSLGLAGAYKEVLGVDAAGSSIQAAHAMALSNTEGKCQFRAGRIQARTLEKLLPPMDANTPEAILLDPPKQGTDPGVIRTLAERAPVRVLHIFCDMDALVKEVNQWRKSGYMIAKVVPLDMFPGTDNLEVMVLFIPDRYSILNRVDKRPPEGYTGPHYKPRG